MYYLISTDYMPNGRTLCSRSKSIWGPYETITITADETFGYHAASLTQVPQGVKYRIGVSVRMARSLESPKLIRMQQPVPISIKVVL